jgi:ketosteroid isomerase-like protein
MPIPLPLQSAVVISQQDRIEIGQLMSVFAWHADQHDAAGLCALFLPEGRFGTARQTYSGHAAIQAEFQARIGKPQRTTRHVWGNLRILEAGAAQIRSAAVQQTFEQDPGQPAIVKVSDIADTFRRNTDGEWRFFERLLDRQMVITSAP